MSRRKHLLQKQKLYRDLWLNFTEQNPSLTRTELGTLLIKERNWLYRYDNAWFLANCPPKQVKTNIKGMRKNLLLTGKREIKSLLN